MPFPPAPLPINMTDATPQQGTHPNLHNQVSQAINDTVAVVQGLQGLGFKANAYSAAAHPGIAQTPVNLNSMRVDWVVDANHSYLIISTCTYNVDAGGIVVQRNVAGSGLFGVAQLTIPPNGWGTVTNVAYFTGNAGPNFIQVTATVSAGFATANERQLMVFDLT